MLKKNDLGFLSKNPFEVCSFIGKKKAFFITKKANKEIFLLLLVKIEPSRNNSYGIIIY
jgi:hypothetical protein